MIQVGLVKVCQVEAGSGEVRIADVRVPKVSSTVRPTEGPKIRSKMRAAKVRLAEVRAE